VSHSSSSISAITTARRPAVGIVLVLLSAFCFGTTGPAAKAVIGAGFSPLEVVQLRVTGAAIILLAIALVRNPASLRVTRRELPFLLAYGLIAFFGIQTLYFAAIARLQVGVALLLEYMAIVLVALWAKFVQKRTLAWTTWTGIGLAVVGLALIEQVWRGPSLDAVGGLCGLGAAVCLAGYFLLSERGLGGRDPLALSALGALVGAIATAVISPPWHLPVQRLAVIAPLGPMAMPAWAASIYVVLVGTVAAYVLGIAALRHLSPPVAGVLSTLEIVIASVVAWVLLGERLGGIELTGAAILFAGVVLAQITPPPPNLLDDGAGSARSLPNDVVAAAPIAEIGDASGIVGNEHPAIGVAAREEDPVALRK